MDHTKYALRNNSGLNKTEKKIMISKMKSDYCAHFAHVGMRLEIFNTISPKVDDDKSNRYQLRFDFDALKLLYIFVYRPENASIDRSWLGHMKGMRNVLGLANTQSFDICACLYEH